MNSLVFYKSLTLNKSLRAEAASMYADVEMMLQMEREGVPAVESLLTQRAFRRVDLEVLVQQLERSELFIASCTHVSSLDLQSEC